MFRACSLKQKGNWKRTRIGKSAYTLSCRRWGLRYGVSKASLDGTASNSPGILGWRGEFVVLAVAVVVMMIIVLILGAMVVFPVLLTVSTMLVSPTDPGSESVVFALFVSRNVMMRVAPVPSELVLLMSGNIHVLEVSIGLFVVLGTWKSGSKHGAKAND